MKKTKELIKQVGRALNLGGRKYYVILNELKVKIVTDPDRPDKPKRFLSVAAANEYGARNVGVWSVIEMFSRNEITKKINEMG